MEVPYLNPWTAFRMSRRLPVLAWTAMAAVTCYGETLTGVVYSNEIGNGSHPAGRFELAVGKKIQTVDYGEQLETHFQSGTCNDIGAEWSVEVTRLDNSLSA